MKRYFRTTPGIYDAVRAQLDTAYGHPFFSDPSTPGVPTTETCMRPAAQAPTDGEGRVYAGILTSDIERPEVAAALSALLAAGQVEEITEAQYEAAAASN